MSPVVIILVGSLGALAPEILRLYSLRNNPDQFRWSWFYIIASVAFAGMGGFVALLLPATTYWGAFYVGISTPVLINTALKKGLDRQQPHFRSVGSEIQQHSLIRSFLKGL